MSEFDWNKFSHERNEENSDDPVTPPWYEKLSEAQKKVYHAITQNFIKIESLIVEGGAITLQQFIKSQLWDEARVFTGNKSFNNGIKAPNLSIKPSKTTKVDLDTLHLYQNI